MKEYTGSYLFPPRPEAIAPPSTLGIFESRGYWAQPKMNGSCGVLFMDGLSCRMMGRHMNYFTRELLSPQQLSKLHRNSGWMALVGEYLNKSQKDASGKPLQGFVIFDILAHRSQHLVGSSFLERQQLLDTLYDLREHDAYIDTIGPSLYRAKNFQSGFSEIWKEMTKIQMYEGMVLKRPDGILENGIREKNNTGWQAKCRKSTRNYRY